MLENKLFYFYKSKLSYWNLIGKYIRWKIFFSSFLITLFICFMLYLNYKFQFTDLSNDGGYFSFIIYILMLLIILAVSISLLILKPSIAFAENKYGVRFQSYQWELFLCAIMKVYLLKHIYIDNEKIEKTEETFEFFIARLEKQWEQKKKESFSNMYSTSSAKTLTIFIPVWAAFNTWLIRDNNDLTSSVQYIVYVSITFFGYLFFWKLVIWRGFLRDFLEGIFERDLIKISILIEKLQIIKFSLENSHHYKEIDECLMNNKQFIVSIIQDFDKKYIYYHPDPLERALRRWKQERKEKKKIQSTSKGNVSN
ncbi:hypothetical protein M4D68_25500 [Priestia aryabhattai]|uniref:hypothetical protein n=1 Tax=Priestia aryabhattai TaxID=412384 RepID=UPI002040F4DC|nr:hypothetical protein [Priestia aryabhattai]MCM3644479.1 hypothetical protein [Priestia aryabhattai]